jgi:hypothetical protein
MKKIKTVCVILVGVAVLAVSFLNIFWPDRPTISKRENRTLASFPEFSISSLIDGTFFSGIDAFVSDNFIGRDFLVDVAQKTDYLRGLSAFVPAHEEAVVFIPSKTGRQSSSDETEELPENEDALNTEPETTHDEQEPPSQEPEETSPEDAVESQPQTSIPPYSRPTDIDPEPSGKSDDPENVEMQTGEDPSASQTASNTSTEQEELGTEIPEDQPDIPEQPASGPPEEEPVKQEEKPSENEETVPEPAVPASPAPADATPPQTVDTGSNSDKAEFLSDGYIIYKNAVHSIPYLVKSTAQKYGDAIDHYAELFKDSRITILVAPLSSGMIDNESIRKRITDQNAMIETINSYCGDNINKVNVYPALFAHRDEYIYYRSDHHWTARGAYYAYAEFAKSVGLEPTPIEDMEEKLLNSAWKGSASSMVEDERVKGFSDELYAYLPTKKNDMTVYESSGDVVKYNGCVRTSWRGYPAFITGDNPYTIINVPDNPRDMTVLVIKDSYGCAFVPFLCEHYGTIIVADPRHIHFDLYDLLKDYPLKDIIFMTNIFNPNVASWVRNVNRIVGN